MRTPTLIADFGQVYLSLQGGTTGTRVLDASNNEMLKIEADETQCLTTTGLVIKNTATTGTARLQLDANTATGNCTLNAPGQEIWLQNRLTGQAPLIVETNGIVTTAYGQNDLSDEKVKQNIRDADLDELQAIFDQAAPKTLRSGRRRPEGPAGLSGPGPAARRRYRKDDAGRQGASDPGLRQADGRAVGRLQEAAGEGRSFGETQEA